MEHAASPLPAGSLLASEIRYRRLFESAKDGILILDADSGVIVDANPFLVNLLGYDQDELIGRALWEIGPFKDIAASREAFLRLQSSEYARYEHLPLETKAREFVEVEFISNVYLVAGQRVVQCNIRDITERRRAAGELQAANAGLANLVTELRRRDAEMQLLHRISSLLQACHSRNEICQVINLMAGDLFPNQAGGLAIQRSDQSELELVARWGHESSMSSSFSPHDCWAIRRGQPHEVTNAGQDLTCHHFNAQPTAGYLCVPLTVQGEFLGLLCLIDDHANADERRLGRRNLVLTFGEAIKLSLFNLGLQEKLREQATRDPLTGLCNRRHLEDSLDRELHRARRLHATLGLAMLDLDHFKLFNDTFGHEAGDVLLQQVGKVLKTELRQSDIACRYGGEEFVLVFPGSTLADTCKRVDDIRTKIRDLSIRHEGRHLGAIMVSAGVAAAPRNGTTAKTLIAAADDALYAAKRNGRDQLVSSEARIDLLSEAPTESATTPSPEETP